MMTLGKLSAQQADNINTMKKMAGWAIVHKAVEDSIKLQNAALINFDWKLDDNGDPSKTSVLRFRDLQKDVSIQKQFLMFIDKPAIIGENKDNDVYE